MECFNCSAPLKGKVCVYCGESAKDSPKKFQLKDRLDSDKRDDYKEKARIKNERKYNNEGI